METETSFILNWKYDLVFKKLKKGQKYTVRELSLTHVTSFMNTLIFTRRQTNCLEYFESVKEDNDVWYDLK